MPDFSQLTERQREIYDFIRDKIESWGYGPTVREIGEAVGLPLDSVTGTGAVAVTPEKLTIAAGTLDAGTVAGLRLIVTGTHQGRPLITFTASWCCSQVLDPAWELRGAGVNGWKRRDCCSVGMPMPVSRTLNRRAHSTERGAPSA